MAKSQPGMKEFRLSVPDQMSNYMDGDMAPILAQRPQSHLIENKNG
jgi:hypothetical protein